MSADQRQLETSGDMGLENGVKDYDVVTKPIFPVLMDMQGAYIFPASLIVR